MSFEFTTIQKFNLKNICDSNFLINLCNSTLDKHTYNAYYCVNNDELTVGTILNTNDTDSSETIDVDGFVFRNIKSKQNKRINVMKLNDSEDLYILKKRRDQPVMTIARILELNNISENIKKYLEYDKFINQAIKDLEIEEMCIRIAFVVGYSKRSNEIAYKIMENIDNLYIDGALDALIIANIIYSVYDVIYYPNEYNIIKYVDTFKKYTQYECLATTNQVEFSKNLKDELPKKINEFFNLTTNDKIKIINKLEQNQKIYNAIIFYNPKKLIFGEGIRVAKNINDIRKYYMNNIPLLFLHYLVYC